MRGGKQAKKMICFLLSILLAAEGFTLQTKAANLGDRQEGTGLPTEKIVEESEGAEAGLSAIEPVKNSETIIHWGSRGGLSYTLTADGLLTISGEDERTAQDVIDDSTAGHNLSPWYDVSYDDKVKSVKVTATNVKDTSMWFYNMVNLKEVDLSEFDASQVIRMDYMFEHCTSLTDLDLSGLDARNVEYMYGMFYDCSSLRNLKLFGHKTGKAVDMGNMFWNCRSLTDVDLSNLDTSNVTNMGGIFADCGSLRSVCLDGVDTSKVTNMAGMFLGCNSLTHIDLSSFDTSRVESMDRMFWGCDSLVYLDLSNFDTRCVTDMEQMFESANWRSSLAYIDLSSFDTRRVTDMSRMFYGCMSLVGLDLSSFDTSQVRDMGAMFSGCDNLLSLDISRMEFDKSQNSSGMLNQGTASLEWLKAPANCSISIPLSSAMSDREGEIYDQLPLDKSEAVVLTAGLGALGDEDKIASGTYFGMDWTLKRNGNLIIEGEYQAEADRGECWLNYSSQIIRARVNARNVTSMAGWFEGCTFLYAVDFNGFDTSQVTDMKRLFKGCGSLVSLDLGDFDTGKVTDISQMFYGCRSLPNLNVSKFDTALVTDMRGTFAFCSALQRLDLKNFDTGRVKDMTALFNGCTHLSGLDISSFQTARVTDMSYMFQNCRSLTELNLKGFLTSNVVSMEGMFNNCRALLELDLGSMNLAGLAEADKMLSSCNALLKIVAPINLNVEIGLPFAMQDAKGNRYHLLPVGREEAERLVKENAGSQEGAGIHDEEDKADSAAEIVAAGVYWGMDWSIDSNGFLRISGEPPINSGVGRGWDTYAAQITSVRVTVKNADSTKEWFKDCVNLKSVDFSGFDTSHVTDMSYMFWNCKSLTELDLSMFDTHNVTDMTAMFLECTSLVKVNMDSFDTSQVTDMGLLFAECESLKAIDLSSFDTSKVMRMEQSFRNCKALEDLDIRFFNTSNVRRSDLLFSGCEGIVSLDLSGLNFGNVSDMAQMFGGCKSLTSLKISDFNTGRVTSMNNMFLDCCSLENLDVSSFNTRRVKDISSMFGGCSSLTSLDIKGFETGVITSMPYMFGVCSSLTGIDLSGFDASNVTNMMDAFAGCGSLEWLRTPVNLNISVDLPFPMKDEEGESYTKLPMGKAFSIKLTKAGAGDDSGEKPGGDVSGGDVSGGDVSDGDVSGGDVSDGDVSGGDVSGGDVSGGDVSGGDTGETPENPGVRKYRVIFDLQEHGKEIESVIVQAGMRLDIPAEPEELGYLFGGWYKESVYENLWDFDTDVVTIDTILYAKWIKDPNTETPKDIDDSVYQIYERTDLESVKAKIAEIKTKVYDGSAYLPNVKVTAVIDGRNTVLTEGLDYRVLYKNNVNAGTGTVIVKGNGRYRGEVTKRFKIAKKPINKLKVITGGMGLKSTAEPPVYVYDGSRLLTEGVDYILSGTNNLTDSAGRKSVEIGAALGGNYTGSKKASVMVYAEENVIQDSDVVLQQGSVKYTGKALKPEVTVTFGGKPLEGKYYSVKYANNKDAGTAYVIVTGRRGYGGCVVKTFEITPLAEQFEVKKPIKAVTYNGRLQKPKVVVFAAGKTLKAGRDYQLLYKNNLHATKEGNRAFLIVKGSGNYADAENAEFEFEINPQKIDKAVVTGTQNDLTLFYAKRKLKLGEEYELEFGVKTRDKISVMVTGKGDFAGTVTRKVRR